MNEYWLVFFGGKSKCPLSSFRILSKRVNTTWNLNINYSTQWLCLQLNDQIQNTKIFFKKTAFRLRWWHKNLTGIPCRYRFYSKIHFEKKVRNHCFSYFPLFLYCRQFSCTQSPSKKTFIWKRGIFSLLVQQSVINKRRLMICDSVALFGINHLTAKQKLKTQ